MRCADIAARTVSRLQAEFLELRMQPGQQRSGLVSDATQREVHLEVAVVTDPDAICEMLEPFLGHRVSNCPQVS